MGVSFLLISCYGDYSFESSYNGRDLKRISNKVVESGSFILPKGDYRGGGRLFSQHGHTYIEVRLIVSGKDVFLNLPLKKNIENIKWDFSSDHLVVHKKNIGHGVTTESYIGPHWEIRLVDSSSYPEYYARRDGEKIFSIKLPKVIQLGYKVDVAEVNSEMEIVYFQTLLYGKHVVGPIEQEAAFSYVLVRK